MARFKTAVIPFYPLCPECHESGEMGDDGSFRCLSCGCSLDSEAVKNSAEAGNPLHRSFQKRGHQ